MSLFSMLNAFRVETSRVTDVITNRHERTFSLIKIQTMLNAFSRDSYAPSRRAHSGSRVQARTDARPTPAASRTMLRVATIAALGVATANAAAISETYPLTADCQVRSRRVQRARFSVRGKRPTSSFVATAAHGDASRELVVRTAQSPSRRSKSRSTRRSTRPSRVAVGSPSFLPTPKRPNADARSFPLALRFRAPVQLRRLHHVHRYHVCGVRPFVLHGHQQSRQVR